MKLYKKYIMQELANPSNPNLWWIKRRTKSKIKSLESHYISLLPKKPLQYILGNQPFASLNIITRPPILIPRWETEEWCLKLCELLADNIPTKNNKAFHILDICTGTGCIPLAISHQLTLRNIPHYIKAIDISPQAIRLSKLNLRYNPSPFVDFQVADAFKYRPAEEDKFDLVVCNPPYIPLNEYYELDKSVLDWEDSRALTTYKNDQGLLFYQYILQNSHLFLKSTSGKLKIPRICMEFGGKQQTEQLKELFVKNGFDVEIWQDLAGVDRCVVGY